MSENQEKTVALTSEPTVSNLPTGMEPTLVIPAGQRTMVFGSAARVGNMSLEAQGFSLTPKDLLSDKILLVAPRIPFDGRLVPALGGIPLIAKIAQGGMGAVYLGYKPMLGVEVAVKVLPMHLVAQQPELVEQFVREARIAARIHSPHLVTVTDVNEQNELFYLVMEFVNGKSAGKYLKDCRAAGKPGVDESTALEICAAAAEGLAAAHADGVIHRDIKPDNILIPKLRGGEALVFTASKVSDLGLAHGGGPEVSVFGASVIGTPGYMAPEQWEAASMAGKPADVFSMGATLYAMLIGQPPFTGSTSQLIRSTIEKPHVPIREIRSDVSASTAALLDRCLAKAADKRYPDASALLDALKTCQKNLDPHRSDGAHTAVSPAPQSETLEISFSDRFHTAKALGGTLLNREEFKSVHMVRDNGWILLDVGKDLDEVIHLLPCGGYRKLFVKTDGPALLRASEPDGPWEVAGMDARSEEGLQALKWVGTGQQVQSVIVKDLLDPRSVELLERTRPTALRIEGKAPFIALKRVEGLKYLSLIGNDSLVDLVALKELGNLQGLNVDGARQLKTLYGIQRLPGLIHLRIANCPQLTVVSGLESLSKLSYLGIAMCLKAELQGALSVLRELTTLQVIGSFCLSDLSGFEGMSKLASLNVSSCYSLKDITALSNLSDLASLNLKRCDLITDLRPLLWLKKLRMLGLPPKTTDADLKQLREAGILENLRILDLGGCTELQDASPLQGLTNLARLTLSGCMKFKVSDVNNLVRTLTSCLVIQ